MSVTVTYEPVVYDCDGSVTEFSFDFPIFQASDLKVIYTDSSGNETELILNINYTASAQNNDYANGGSIVTEETYPAGDTITIERSVPYIQPNDFTGNTLNTITIENTFDRLLMLIQQVYDKYARVLQQPATDGSGNLTLPNATDRANKFLGFDGNGDPIASAAVTGVTVTSFMETVLDDENAATARATLDVPSNSEFAIAEKASFLEDQTIDSGVSLNDPIYYNITKETVDTCDIADWTDDAEMTTSVNTSIKMTGNALNLTKDTGAAALCSTSKTVIKQIDFASKDLYFFFYIKDQTTLDKLVATDAIIIRYGSDASNYYQWSVDKADLSIGWNLLGPFDTDNEDSTTGSPTSGAMDYVYIALTATDAALVWSPGDVIMDYWYVASDAKWKAADKNSQTPQAIYGGSNKVILKGYHDGFENLIPGQWYFMDEDGNLTIIPGEAYNATRLFYSRSATEAIVDISVEGNKQTITPEQGMGGTIKGFIMGGYDAGTYTTDIEALIFSDESEAIIAATLDTAKTQTAGVSSSSKGYAMGGYYGGYTTIIEDIIFSDETSQTISATLDDSRSNGAGVFSEIKGYCMGGTNGTIKNKIDDINFSTETSTELSATIDSARNAMAGVNSSAKGYVLGGNESGTASVTTIEALVFSDESEAAIGATLDTARHQTAGVFSAIKGYAIGGRTGAGPTWYNKIDDLVFATETSQEISATLDTAKGDITESNISSISKGYVCGGNTGALTNVIEDLTFSTETSEVISATLDTAKKNAAGVQY